MSRSPGPGSAGRCSRTGPRAATGPPGAARTPPTCPAARSIPARVGKTYTAPDGKTFRPSMFVTLTCPSYGRVDHRGVPVDPARLRLRPGRAGRADLRRAVRPVHPEPAPLPRPRRAVLRRRRTPAQAGPAHPHRHPRHHRPRRTPQGAGRHLPPGLVARHTASNTTTATSCPSGTTRPAGYVDPATGEVLPDLG